jgi:hypothetical protein
MGIPDTDAAYYRMRETQERDRASSAAFDEIRAVHLTLAEKYRMLASSAERQENGGVDGAGR